MKSNEGGVLFRAIDEALERAFRDNGFSDSDMMRTEIGGAEREVSAGELRRDAAKKIKSEIRKWFML